MDLPLPVSSLGTNQDPHEAVGLRGNGAELVLPASAGATEVRIRLILPAPVKGAARLVEVSVPHALSSLGEARSEALALRAAFSALTMLGVFLEGVLEPTLDTDLASSLSMVSLVTLLALFIRSDLGVDTETELTVNTNNETLIATLLENILNSKHSTVTSWYV